MAYWAGMIWSVSMLAPNFHALPRMTFGSVISPLPPSGGGSGRGARMHSSDPSRHVFQHLARVRDDAGDRARRGDRRVGQVDHRLRVAHAAGEVAVRGREADLAFTEHSHMPAKASTARRRRPGRARGKEDADQALLLGLDRDLMRRRR